MSPSDQEYVQACLNGHPEAFRPLVERYQSALAAHLRCRLADQAQAEEIAQEAFVRAYFALGKLRKQHAFFPWLWGIADRVAKESRRAARRTPTLDPAQIDLQQPEPADGARLESVVSQAVTALPNVYREVIWLRFFGGHRCEEISRHLGVPVGTVTKRLSRAYGMLRKRLGDCLHSGDAGECPSFREAEIGLSPAPKPGNEGLP